MPPQWFARADFDVVNDPAGTKGQVWKANGSSPSGSFVVRFQDGDRLDGLAIEAYGDGSPGGLKNIQVLYQPDASVPQHAIATGDDLGRGPKWGAVTFPNLQPTVLSSNGAVTVLFDVIGTGYYIGQVTPTLERPCKP
jgi:hypothetical protein